METPDERPLCECHGEPKYWTKDPRRKSGGYWVCLVKKCGYQATWRSKNTKRISLWRRARYLRRLSEGLCGHCGKNPHVNGITRCNKCARDFTDRRRLKRRAEQIAAYDRMAA